MSKNTPRSNGKTRNRVTSPATRAAAPPGDVPADYVSDKDQLTGRQGDGSFAEGMEAKTASEYRLKNPNALTDAEKEAIKRVGPTPSNDSITSGINDF